MTRNWSVGCENIVSIPVGGINFPLRHPFPLQSSCAVPHTGLTFSSCGHWTVSLIWDWECCPCILAIYSRTTTSHYQCSRSLPSRIAPPLPNPKTWEQDHDVEHSPIRWRDFQRKVCVSQVFWRILYEGCTCDGLSLMYREIILKAALMAEWTAEKKSDHQSSA